MDQPKIIAVVGTNASGKSALGIALAQRFGGEILSADSRQVYRGFDLCCGKVTAAERALVPHHLLDLRDVGEPFSVSDYQALAYALVPGILARGRVPFLVGGTGLYVAAVVHGYDLRRGEPDETLRAALEEKTLGELRALLPDAERERLRANPSDYANRRRLIRCIEKSRTAEGPAGENAPRYRSLQLGLTWPAAELSRRIDRRLAQRLQEGMVDEIRDYLDAGGDAAALDALGLEYRYILRYLRGEYGSEAEFAAALSAAIKRFAKRQMTWFRRDMSIVWLKAEDDYVNQAATLTAGFLSETP